MGDACGLGVEASGRQRLQRGGIERFTVTRVPGAGQDRHLAIVRVRVWRELVSGGKLQAERIGAGLGGIPHQVDLLHARHRQAALRAPVHFRRRHGDGVWFFVWFFAWFFLGVKAVYDGGKLQAAQRQSQSTKGHVKLRFELGGLLAGRSEEEPL
jgi:hypothetical protein